MLLVLDRPGLALGYERASLVVYEDGKRLRALPVRQVQRVVVGPSVELGAGVLGLLSEHGVPLLVLNHRHPERTAELVAYRSGNARRRLAQYAFYHDAEARRRWSAWVVGLKLRYQRRLLELAREQRPDLRLPLSHGAAHLAELETHLTQASAPPDSPLWQRSALPDSPLWQRGAWGDLERTGSHPLDTIRGWEGSAAAMYFQAFTSLFAPRLGFTARRRRPPTDPVNACLSLSYVLVHFEAGCAARMMGLDPMLGGFHEPAYGQDALASDLLEPLRPLVDKWVWSLFREETLRPEHFRQSEEGCRLHRHAQAVYYDAYAQRARPWRRLLRLYARAFVAVLPDVPAG